MVVLVKMVVVLPQMALLRMMTPLKMVVLVKMVVVLPQMVKTAALHHMVTGVCAKVASQQISAVRNGLLLFQLLLASQHH